MIFSCDKRKKAEKLEAKADRLVAKGRFEKAMRKYRQALLCDPARSDIYDKMIAARDQMPGEWQIGDFVESVDLAMMKQEHDNPSMKQVHARLSPEWEGAKKIAISMLECTDEAATARLADELCAMGEIGTRAAIGLLMDLKKAMHGNAESQEDVR